MKRMACLAAVVAVLAGCGESGTQSTAGAAAHPGEQTYMRFCYSCHAAGIASAPKVGNADYWAPRIAKGADALLKSTIEGIAPGMPARGLCNQCSDQELADAIDYMISKSQ
jgi:cytochrome c5